MNDSLELEYKFRADDIKLLDFIDFMNSTGYNKRKDMSSWDYYYVNKEKDSFLRFRDSETPELTKKLKTNNNNNWSRIEVDVPLDKTRVTEDVINKFAELEGYNLNFKIYKSCFVFWRDTANFVYYIVYDENLVEKGRFIEVEVEKSAVPMLNSKLTGGAIGHLKTLETSLQRIGISSKNRLKKSLFEMFVK
jgi:hypothetical protein